MQKSHDSFFSPNATDILGCREQQPNVRRAIIYGLKLKVDHVIFLFPNLQVLEITETDFRGLEHLATSLKSLRELSLRSCRLLTKDEIANFGNSLMCPPTFFASLASETRIYDTFKRLPGEEKGQWIRMFVQ